MKRLMTIALAVLLSLGVVSVSVAQQPAGATGAAGEAPQAGKATKKHTKKHKKKHKAGKKSMKEQAPAAGEGTPQ